MRFYRQLVSAHDAKLSRSVRYSRTSELYSFSRKSDLSAFNQLYSHMSVALKVR